MKAKKITTPTPEQLQALFDLPSDIEAQPRLPRRVEEDSEYRDGAAQQIAIAKFLQDQADRGSDEAVEMLDKLLASYREMRETSERRPSLSAEISDETWRLIERHRALLIEACIKWDIELPALEE